MPCHQPPRPRSIAGFSLIEALVTLVVIGLGVLAAAGLQIGARKGQQEASQRTSASTAIQDLTERMTANPRGLNTYIELLKSNPSTTNGGLPASAAGACAGTGDCSPQQIAEADLGRWWGGLTGTDVTAGTDTTPVLDAPTVCLCLRQGATNDFRLTLAWRGAGPAGSYAGEGGVKAGVTCGDTDSASYDDPDTEVADVTLRRTETVRYVFPDSTTALTATALPCPDAKTGA